jgi:hypothetical protein
VSPKLRALLPRIILIAGVAGIGLVMAPHVPKEQSIVVRLGSRQVTRVSGVVTRLGEQEPTAGFSQDFPGGSPRTLRHEFSAPNGTYIVVITFSERSEAGTAGAAGAVPPKVPETSFERRVSLGDGEVTVSPD